jgi:hypothetical protein
VPVILIIGGISLYFLFSGLIALLKNRMTVVNPHADTPSTSVDGVIFDLLKKKPHKIIPYQRTSATNQNIPRPTVTN